MLAIVKSKNRSGKKREAEKPSTLCDTMLDVVLNMVFHSGFQCPGGVQVPGPLRFRSSTDTATQSKEERRESK
eukprot:scaffold6545_cov135-Skeletonema_menzelii.AAC.4